VVRKFISIALLDAVIAAYPPDLPPTPATRLAVTAPRTAGRTKADNRVARCRAYLKKLDGAVMGQNGSDRTFHVARLIWADFAIDEAEGYPLLEEFNQRCEPPWDEDGNQGLTRKWDEAVKKGGERGGKLIEREQHSGPSTSPSSDNPVANVSVAAVIAEGLKGRFDDTDVATGRTFVRQHGEYVRYVDDWKHWAYFDGSRWVPDKSGVWVEGLAKITTEFMADQAVVAIGKASVLMKDAADEHEQAAAKKAMNEALSKLAWAKASQDMKRIRNMLVAARSEYGVMIRFARDVFDRHPHYLNCPNGTIDLRTGERLPHTREHFITKVCPTEYHPDATRSVYLSFLNKIFEGTSAIAEYVRRLSGYVATAETCDHTSHFWWGDGSNGKSVLFLLWLEALGSSADGYACTPPPSLLMDEGWTRHPTEKVCLRGSRLAVCSETKEDEFLNEQTLKALVGDDMIQARGMRQDFFYFPPSHKLIIPTNHPPKVRGSDHGIWRRIRKVPFAKKFWKEEDRMKDPAGDLEYGPGKKYDPDWKADPTLLDRLKAETEGVLADMVEHAVKFYQGGRVLIPTEEVCKATADYQKSENHIGTFLEDMVRADPEGRIAGGEFYGHFKKWWIEEGYKEKFVPSARRFGDEAKKKYGSFKQSKIYYRVAIVEDSPTHVIGRVGELFQQDASNTRARERDLSVGEGSTLQPSLIPDEPVSVSATNFEEFGQ
jgi:putative DNA primase/helicase